MINATPCWLGGAALSLDEQVAPGALLCGLDPFCVSDRCCSAARETVVVVVSENQLDGTSTWPSCKPNTSVLHIHVNAAVSLCGESSGRSAVVLRERARAVAAGRNTAHTSPRTLAG